MVKLRSSPALSTRRKGDAVGGGRAYPSQVSPLRAMPLPASKVPLSCIGKDLWHMAALALSPLWRSQGHGAKWTEYYGSQLRGKASIQTFSIAPGTPHQYGPMKEGLPVALLPT